MIELLFSAILSAAAPADGASRTQIDGHIYRVTVKSGIVTVANKALVVNNTIEERERQRKAAKLVTGCNPVDEMSYDDGRLHAKLDCLGKN